MINRLRKIFRKPMKLGVSYSVWDGEELLEYAIKSICEQVDYVNVVWQKSSWYGEECSPDLEKTLNKLVSKGLIDELIFFEPDSKLEPAKNEINKRNVGLKAAIKNKCTHFMTADVDEMYFADDFKKAKEYIYNSDITHSACNQVFYPTTTMRSLNYMSFVMPFIYKVNRFSKLKFNAYKKDSPYCVDPTRQIAIGPFSIAAFTGKITAQHYGGVRKNIDKKINNSSGLPTQEQKISLKTGLESLTETGLQSGELIEVPNYFNIEI